MDGGGGLLHVLKGGRTADCGGFALRPDVDERQRRRSCFGLHCRGERAGLCGAHERKGGFIGAGKHPF